MQILKNRTSNTGPGTTWFDGLFDSGHRQSSGSYMTITSFPTVAMSAQGWILEGLSGNHAELRKCRKTSEIIIHPEIIVNILVCVFLIFFSVYV